MARKQQRLIAAEYADGELRLVSVNGGSPSIEAFAAVPITSSHTVGGVPRDANVAAEHLRKGLQELGRSEGDVAFGLPADAVSVRILDIPNVPDADLESVLEGEVQHYGVTRGFGARFGYTRITPGPNSNPNEPQALVMGAEGPTLSALADGAERARLECTSIEPSLLAGMRVAAEQAKGAGPHLLAAVGHEMADLALVGDKGILFYRRLQPVKAAEDSGSYFAAAMGVSEEEADIPSFLKEATPAGPEQGLVVEFSRTLDYIRREFGSVGKTLTIALSSPTQLPLLESLRNELGLEVTLAKAPLPDESQAILFTNAYGLTRRQRGLMPVFDLRPFDPLAEELGKAKRNLALSMVVGLALLIVGTGAAVYFGLEAKGVEDQVSTTQRQIQDIKTVQLPRAEERAAKLGLYRSLLGEGLPVPQVLDAVAASLEEGTGIETIELRGSQLTISGEARDEQSMIRSMEMLQRQEGITGVVLESFDTNTEGDRFVKFKLAAQLADDRTEVTP